MTAQQRLASIGIACVVITAVIGLLAVGAFIGGADTTTQSSSPTLSAQNAVLEETEIVADTTQLRANLHEDGDAAWVLTYRQELDSDSDREAFEELKADIEAEPDAYLDPFEERMQQLVETAESTTDREMSMDNFSVEAERVQQPQGELGLVTFRFDWSGFAAETDGQIEAGDAIDQLILQDDEQLIITWPDTFELDSVTPNPSVQDNTQVRWEGPREFDAGQPRVTVTETEAAPPDDDETTDDTDDVTDEDAFGSWLLAGVALFVLIAGALAYGWYRRTDGETDTSAEGPARVEQPETDEPQHSETDEQSASTELLSSEEQVLQVVEEHGGRVKQQVVTEELDWSAARTSQVVGNLRDDGQIETFRLGRENVLTVPEQSLAESPEPDEEN